jgi:uncharacterized protein YjbI with pentapeptide repeats
MAVRNMRHLPFLWISVKNMKLKIVATVALLACFGFAEQALGLNQLDLDQLKATNACPRCNLSGADLTQLNLTGVNLRGADLSGATLSQANLTNADLTGANLEGAVLNSVNLSGASLTGANLKSASLENADLSYAGFISANLEAANLKDAKLLFTNFRGANFRLTTQANGVVTSDKPYGWSLERQNPRECNEFQPENTPGTICYTK